MSNNRNAEPASDYPLPVIFQAALADSLMAFTEFSFGVVRPDVPFKRNWHHEALTEKLSQVARGEVRRLIINLASADPKIAVRIGGSAGLVPGAQSI